MVSRGIMGLPKKLRPFSETALHIADFLQCIATCFVQTFDFGAKEIFYYLLVH